MKRARLVVLVTCGALLALGLGLARRGASVPFAAPEEHARALAAAAQTSRSADDLPSMQTAPRGHSTPAQTLHDRQARDAVRERLVAAWSRAGSTPTATPAAYAPMPEAPDGGVDPGYVRERVREDFIPMARQCYDELLARAPDAGGRIVVNFTIVGDEKVGGVIDEASIGDASTLTDERMATCFRESMMSMAFRPPKGAGKVTVEYPFELAPGEDEEDGAATGTAGR
jgi:hypothetical protein